MELSPIRAFASSKYRFIFPIGMVLAATYFLVTSTSWNLNGIKFLPGSDDCLFYVLHCFVSLAAFGVYAFVVRKTVAFSLLARTCLLGGMTSFFPHFALNGVLALCGTSTGSLYSSLAGFIASTFLFATLEEITKLFAVLFHVQVGALPGVHKTVACKTQFVVLAAAVGSGFEILENFFYFGSWLVLCHGHSYKKLHLPAVQRSLQPAHPLLTALAACFIRDSLFANLTYTWKDFCKSLIVSSLLHFIFNFIVLMFPHLLSQRFRSHSHRRIYSALGDEAKKIVARVYVDIFVIIALITSGRTQNTYF